ncbi:DPP IV N-terminal domain-containing protein, partial [Acidobacteria bacterium AH-259-L09]|nr:DPP IV N-terminal domain-containing protein [Acidobacteria bacterium AH-259-L09]
MNNRRIGWVLLASFLVLLIIVSSSLAQKGDQAEEVSQMVVPDVRLYGLVAPSRDGRYLPSASRGDLTLHDLATGKKRRLVKSSPGHAEYSTVSPDGKQIVYEWDNSPFFDELHIIGIDGSGDRLLYRNEEEIESIRPYAWSPDGKQVLVLFRLRDQTWKIAWVSVADGSLQVLKSLRWRYARKMSLSPDGRYIVYDLPTQQDSADRDIFLLAADGRSEAPLIQHPAVDSGAVWTPDGKKVLFVSDRAGSVGLWVVRVADGKRQGPPQLVKPDMGRMKSLGFTRDGSYYYALSTGQRDIYTAEMDPSSGKITTAPTRASERFRGRGPDWSPDGKYLAYASRRGPKSGLVLVIRSLETGQERELSPRFNNLFFRGPRWSPDGRFLLVRGGDRRRRSGLDQIDVQTGDVGRIVQISHPGQNAGQGTWSPDGKSIFYVLRDDTKKTWSVMVRDLQTDQEKELYRVTSPGRIYDLVLSPDGRHLGFLCAHRTTRSTALKLLPTMGGEALELLTGQKEERIWPFAWTPDGRYLLFGKSHP